MSVVRHISDRIGVMYLGEIVETGEAEGIFAEPRHPYTLALISTVPTTEKKGAGEEPILLEGSMPSAVSPPAGCKFHTRCFMAREVCQRETPPFIETEKGRFVRCHFADIPAKEKRKLAKEKQKTAVL